MPMKNPPHPGMHVRHDCLEPLRLSVTEGAKVLGVTRQALNNLVTGKSGISPEMPIRLSKAFGGRPAVWLKMPMLGLSVILDSLTAFIRVFLQPLQPAPQAEVA